ncbi:hypothetical protein [Streptomyces sp. SID12488]|uniref:hypothetical protein n=1 Tax=Streptomyces sp. SID12488 TaxID=2706040 RepID=UPI0013DD2914|nr:hypothetical protein [Streptomyces sp. SID12488]NEA62624.1 hypothetical protein [Streptomyces sp. SID12488]
MTVVAHTTSVVNPKSCLGIHLQSYGPVGVPLRSNNRRRAVRIGAVVHRQAFDC